MPPVRLAVLLLLAVPLGAQGGWAPPVLQSALNSSAPDSGVQLSADGLTLHFSSFRSGDWELWAATRPAIGAPWTAPVHVAALGDPAVDDHPWLAASGLEIWFSSARSGGAGASDILRATRASVGGSWSSPTFVTEVNSAGAESAPSITADGLELFFYSTGWGNPSGTANSLFVATRASTTQPFGTPQLVTAFAIGNPHRDCDVAADGLSIVFTEFVSPRFEVMFSERASRTAPWAAAVTWSEFSAVGVGQGVYSFTRSAGGDEAYLSAAFPAGAGAQEILRTTRVAAAAVAYGTGCPGTGAFVPAIGASGQPRTGNAAFAFTVAGALPSAFAVLVAGFAPDSLAVGGCTVLVAAPWVPLPAVALDASGSGVAPLPIPPAPALLGFTVYGQWLVADPGGQFLGLGALSNALHVRVGH